MASFEMKGSITFLHDRGEDNRRRVVVSTCALTLTIPVNKRYIGDAFGKCFIEDILESPGFGRI